MLARHALLVAAVLLIVAILAWRKGLREYVDNSSQHDLMFFGSWVVVVELCFFALGMILAMYQLNAF